MVKGGYFKELIVSPKSKSLTFFFQALPHVIWTVALYIQGEFLKFYAN